PCTQIGKELWAFVPRSVVPLLGLNFARIDSSPRASDVFGDFDNSGAKKFHTVLTFSTGIVQTTLPAPVTPAPAQQAAVFALDITDPGAPKILWEYDRPAVPAQ